MKKFIWSDDYSVGVQLIDEQHQHFFEIINNTIELMSKNYNKEDVFAILGQLGDYAHYHFSTEEEYFAEFKCENVDLHIKIHNQFREKMKNNFNLIREKEADIKGLAEEISVYCGNWLINHILIMDKEYSSCFKKHGLN